MKFIKHWFKAMFLGYPYWRARLQMKEGPSQKTSPLLRYQAKVLKDAFLKHYEGTAYIYIDYTLIDKS